MASASAGVEFNGQDVKCEKEFPSQHEKRNHRQCDGEEFTERHAGTPGLETASEQSKDVEGRKAENSAPEDVIDADPGDRHLKNECTKHEFGPRSWSLARCGAACPAILHGFWRCVSELVQ